jgi:hypothetical protein
VGKNRYSLDEIGLPEGGQLIVDLTNVQMTPAEYRSLVNAVQATVVGHLARQADNAKIVAVSLLPNNNGQEPEPPPPPKN